MPDEQDVPNGDSEAEAPLTASRLAPLVYDELRALARRHVHDRPGPSMLQPTALVHETYLRLQGRRDAGWEGRSHFLAVAAKAMRQILIDHARAARSQKRWGGLKRVTLHDPAAWGSDETLDMLALNEALNGLARRRPRQARVAELRLFAGMTVAEAAEILEVSERTVKEDWRMARARLTQALREASRPER